MAQVLLGHVRIGWPELQLALRRTAPGVLTAWSVSFVPKLFGNDGKTNGIA